MAEITHVATRRASNQTEKSRAPKYYGNCCADQRCDNAQAHPSWRHRGEYGTGGYPARCDRVGTAVGRPAAPSWLLSVRIIARMPSSPRPVTPGAWR